MGVTLGATEPPVEVLASVAVLPNDVSTLPPAVGVWVSVVVARGVLAAAVVAEGSGVSVELSVVVVERDWQRRVNVPLATNTHRRHRHSHTHIDSAVTHHKEKTYSCAECGGGGGERGAGGGEGGCRDANS